MGPAGASTNKAGGFEFSSLGMGNESMDYISELGHRNVHLLRTARLSIKSCRVVGIR